MYFIYCIYSIFVFCFRPGGLQQSETYKLVKEMDNEKMKDG